MNVDMKKVRAEMAEHWDMDNATFDAHTVNSTFEHGDWGGEVDFKDADGKVAFFIEVNADSEVWNMDFVD